MKVGFVSFVFNGSRVCVCDGEKKGCKSVRAAPGFIDDLAF